MCLAEMGLFGRSPEGRSGKVPPQPIDQDGFSWHRNSEESGNHEKTGFFGQKAASVAFWEDLPDYDIVADPQVADDSDSDCSDDDGAAQ